MGEHGFTLSVCVPETVEGIDGITCMKEKNINKKLGG